MKVWFRVDNRLVHGQIIEAWLPYLDASELVVINDALAEDELRQQIMRLAVPGRVKAHFLPLHKAKSYLERLAADLHPALFLFASCADAYTLVGQGVQMPILNIGNMHYTDGKLQICQHVAVSNEDRHYLDSLIKIGTKLDFRCVPGDIPIVEEWTCQ